MAFLSPDRVRTEKLGSYSITIKEKITPDTARATKYVASWINVGDPVKPCRKLNNGTGHPKGITVHNTDKFNAQAGTNCAEQSARATWPNQNSGGAAVHFWVYQNEIWQQLDETEQGWHAADGSNRRKDHRGSLTGGNLDTIAIECIETGNDSVSEETLAKLVAYLCRKYELDPMKDVYTHNYWMYGVDKFVKSGDTVVNTSGVKETLTTVRKNCPYYILNKWTSFLNTVNTFYKAATTVSTAASSTIEKFYMATVMGTANAYIEAYCKTLKGLGFYTNVSSAYSNSASTKTGMYTGVIYGTDLNTLSNYMRGLKNARPEMMITISEPVTSDVNTVDDMSDLETKQTTTTVTKPTTTTLAVGDAVKVASNAVQYETTKAVAAFVTTMTMYVTSISGNRVVISTTKGGPATYAIDKKYLTKI